MADQQRFEQFRDDLRSAFPVWTEIRKNPKAVGSQFLGVIGKRFADVEWVLDYALRQMNLLTADESQTDVLYLAYLPGNLKESMDMRFSGGSHIYQPMDNMAAFLEGDIVRNRYSPIGYDTRCHIDYEHKKLYVHRPFNKGEKFQNGHVTVTIFNAAGESIEDIDIPLSYHHVWNFFDEFGLLFGLSRLQGERNHEYRERILDVFRRPAGNHKAGLINGISRELGLIHELQWEDGGKDLVIERSRIMTETITVDGVPWSESYTSFDRSGRLVLKGLEEFSGYPRVVRFSVGVRLHELHDKSDTTFQNELRYIDGTATPLLQYYVEQINARVPIMWGKWKWNQGFWDVTDADISGYGYVPNVYDATFSGWKDYKEE